MQKEYIIGLDIGTTSAKAVIFHQSGHVVAEAEEQYPVYHPHSSWAEQDPKEIEQATALALDGALQKSSLSSSQIHGVGLSSAMHSLICVDKENNPLSPMITWADGRSVRQANHLKNSPLREIYLKTGTPLHPMSPLNKLLWMKENNYPAYQQASKFISIKEYILTHWFGHAKADYSIASATGLFNIHSFTWEQQALHIAGIKEEQLNSPTPPTEIYQGMKQEIAERIGIEKDLPFVIGASDGPLANLGIGAIEAGDMAVTIGTSGAIRQMSQIPELDDKQEIFCYAFTNDLWIKGGPTNNGAVVLQWMKQVLGEHEAHLAKSTEEDVYQLLTSLAKQSPAGANGLLFLPYLNGERAPLWDAQARGSYVGLNMSHSKKDMLRAGLEGVIFCIYSIAQSLERLSGPSNQLFASGGFARSPLWLQILTDVFGQSVQVPESHQSSAWGAAWLALYSLGEVNSLADIKASIPMQDSYQPKMKNHMLYQELYPIFQRLYGVMREEIHHLATFQESH